MRRVHTSRRTLDGCRLIVLATLVCLVSVPGLALAQSTIVGVVKDASGAVVPGVTVEAASDALIEQQKSATTNGRNSPASPFAPSRSPAKAPSWSW